MANVGAGGTGYNLRNSTGAKNFSVCPLNVYDASSAHDGAKIGIAWGTICGRQPASMAAGGDPPYLLPVTGEGYVYAEADADLSSQQWVASSIFTDTDGFKANTATTAYRVIASYSVDNSGAAPRVIVTSSCGNVDFAFCDLIPGADTGSDTATGGGSSGKGTIGDANNPDDTNDDGDDDSGDLTTGGLTTGGLTTGGLTTGGLSDNGGLTTGGLTTGGLTSGGLTDNGGLGGGSY